MRTHGARCPVVRTKADFPFHRVTTECVPYCCFPFPTKLMQVLLVKGLESGSSSGWFVRGIPGARDL